VTPWARRDEGDAEPEPRQAKDAQEYNGRVPAPREPVSTEKEEHGQQHRERWKLDEEGVYDVKPRKRKNAPEENTSPAILHVAILPNHARTVA
jgi:hypothetical protein